MKKKKRTQRPLYSQTKILKAIEGSGGIISIIKDALGCDWHTADNRIKADPILLLAYEAELEGILDLGEQKLIQAIQNGDIGAIKFLLATKGKKRGYTESRELTGPGGGPIPLVQTVIVTDRTPVKADPPACDGK